jgi:zinc transport system ATP-binding protein
MVTNLIEFKEVCFAYNCLPILEKVNLTVKERDFIVIVGPNGGGKTTLLKLILGLLAPTKGTVNVLGEPPKRVLEQIGYVQQSFQFDNQFPVTALDVVMMGILRKGLNINFHPKRVKISTQNALAQVGLSDYAKRPFSDLSGGQQQRVLIARALVSNPRIILLDEPMAHVDAMVESELYGLLSELNRNLTILLVSHDVGYVSTVANRVLCVNRSVVEHPTTDISDEHIIELYGRKVHTIVHDHRINNGGKCD